MVVRKEGGKVKKKRNSPAATRYDGTQWQQQNWDSWLEDLESRDVDFFTYCNNWFHSLAATEEQRRETEWDELCEVDARRYFEGHSKRSAELFIVWQLLNSFRDRKISDDAIEAFELGRLLERCTMRWMEEHAAVRVTLHNKGTQEEDLAAKTKLGRLRKPRQN